ncbi:cysteine hydrolase [Acidisoma cellulosilytica]|uniref:Cysteine hydrolase n=1 Tax=Acidisoma cellulosilyticum TaxID=2802395 RepID=A0A963Z1S0_9PROT|nr:cysteine hydrolase [Acidisoma cellulosilyticum]MCB8880253.1 cysteine hydrolase [Acidisoma cellulosilyticum]
MPVPGDEWLLVIDMQRVFADAPSPWASPDFYRALPQVMRLVEAYRGRVILTRYVAPMPPTGAWIPYFAAFPSVLRAEDDAIWDLALPVGEGALVETRETFSKWDARMAQLVGPDSRVAVCGVATECCVLGTVLGAVDAGRFVRVVTDACAGGTPDGHDQACAILSGFAPMVSLVTTGALLAD